MKTSVLFLLFSIGAIAQTTTVTGTITDPAGDLVNGSCSIQAWGPFSAAAGWRVVGVPMTVSFTAGAFSATLAPTDSATPAGQNYKVTCAVPRQVVTGRTVGPYSWGPRYWLVPTSGSPLDIGDVEVTTPPPSPSWTLLWAQLPPPSLTGTFCVESVDGVIGWVTCTGGSGSASFGSITPGTNAFGALVVTTGSTLGPAGTGTVNANRVNGGVVPVNANVLATDSLGRLINYAPVTTFSLDTGLSGNPGAYVATTDGTGFNGGQGSCAVFAAGTNNDLGVLTAAISNGCLFWNGVGNQLIITAGQKVNSLGTGTVEANRIRTTSTDPGCTVTADIGREWLDTTSAVTSHFKLCAEVASAPAWVQVF